MGETSGSQSCLNFMGASNILIIIGQMLLQLWGTVVGLRSLQRRQRSWEQKSATWTYHSLFPLRTDLLSNKVNNSYTTNGGGGGGYPVEFKSTNTLHEIFDPWFHTLVKLDLEVHVPLNWTKARMIQGDVLCLIKVSWRRLFSYSSHCWADEEPEWETDREFPV